MTITAPPKKQIALLAGLAFAIYGAAIPVAKFAIAIAPSDSAGDSMAFGALVLLSWGAAFLLGCYSLVVAKRHWAEYSLWVRLLAVAPVALPVVFLVVVLIVWGP
jgi:hypothetical protein